MVNFRLAEGGQLSLGGQGQISFGVDKLLSLQLFLTMAFHSEG